MSGAPSVADTEKTACVNYRMTADPSVAIVEQKLAPLSPNGWRKVAIVSVLCSAQFFDIFNACASIAALPSVCFSLFSTQCINSLDWDRLVPP